MKIIIEYVKSKYFGEILTKALERLKFVELYDKIGVKKVWDEEKIKEEYVVGDILSLSVIGARGLSVTR